MQALEKLNSLGVAVTNRTASESVSLMGQAIVMRMPLLRGLTPEKVTLLSAVIAVGKTSVQITQFVNKYKDIKTEAELYDALIQEILEPLGLNWTAEAPPSIPDPA